MAVSKIDALLSFIDSYKSPTTNTNHEEKCSSKVCIASKMSDAVVNAKYAVRGAIVARANAIQSELKTNSDKVMLMSTPKITGY